MRFEWDVDKAKVNRRKHGITFEEALFAFYDPLARIEVDDAHSTENEIRETLIGEAAPGIVIVVFTVRERGEVYRIISARRATRRERQGYEEAKKL
jgi:uncharacterized DUF497 family protein